MAATYRAGDRVHVTGFGKAVVREARNNGRYLVELKGRAMEVSSSELSPLSNSGADVRRGRPSGRPKSVEPSETHAGESEPSRVTVTIDLHGHTVDEALDLLERTLNDALLAGASELRVIHGKSGGRIKAAVHQRLGQVPSVQSFRLDPQNAGVTLVEI